MLHAVIMAGGSGTRFWPLSRSRTPKQLLKLAGRRTMIQQTVDRSTGLISHERNWIVTNRTQVDQTRRQLPEIPPNNLLVEPTARNTAPCIGLAAVHLLHQDPDAVMFVMPADHVISPNEVFQESARRAAALVEENPGRLVLFGVPPTEPSTGFGYIERAASLGADFPAFQVASFREKPPRETAQQYVDSGNFYWNCGIFCWRAATIVEQLRKYEPDIHDRLKRLAASVGTEDYDSVLAGEFPQMNSIAIDCAVLERAQNVCVIEALFDWDDVGSWLAVPRLAGSDENGNTTDGSVVALDAHNCIIRSANGHLVAALGIDDCIIVHTEEVTLVARRDESERIRELLAVLQQNGYTDVL